MKRIIIISSFATTALFTLTGGVQAQNSIEQVLKNIETNNKELQANAQLITSQKLESKTDNNLPDPTLSYAHLWEQRTKTKQSANSSFRRVSTSPACMPRAIN